jgi:hypothetical protein
MYKHDETVHVRVVSSVTQREGGHSDELEEVVLPRGHPNRVARPRPGHGRAAGAKRARVWEVGTVTGTRLFRIGGFLVFVGAVAFVLYVVLRSVLSAGVDPAVSAQGSLWVQVNALGALGAALVLLGLPAVVATRGMRIAEDAAHRGGLGVGFVAIAVQSLLAEDTPFRRLC